ncbi:MAG: hypothetical protein ACUVRA_04980 [Candidatus Bathyarchaeaceae archaeon]
MKAAEVIRKRKIPIAIATIVIIGTLLTLLVFVPLVFGGQFVHLSFQPRLRYIDWPKRHMMEVVLPNGSVGSISYMELTVNVTNNYFVPVEVRYNGFEFVWLIYNRTVDDPKDVVGNKNFLVWGAFHAAYSIEGWGMYGFDWWGTALGNMTGYEYYLTRKDLSNYTKTIPVGTSQYYAFDWSPWFPKCYWYGQDLYGLPVSPGTYQMYCIAYGKIAGPLNLTVTSILWPIEE